MLLHADSLPENALIESDLCIIGAGAAGITIAHSLRDTDISVSLLESGERDFNLRAQELNSGDNIGLPYEPLDVLRLRMLGGTTNHWEGSCNALDDIDFMARPWVRHSVGWPITKQDLTPYYKRAHEYLQLGPYDYDLKSWSTRLGVRYPDWFHGGLEGAVTQQSPPTRFGEVYGPDLDRASNVRVILGSTALSLQMNADHTLAVEAKIGRFGKPHYRARAHSFVLALGGIENARFLLLNNLGNDRDQVGRHFMDHPYFRLMLLAPSPTFLEFKNSWDKVLERGGRIIPEIKFSQSVLWKEQFQNSRLAFEPATRLEASLAIESFHRLESGGIPRTTDEFFYHLGNLIVDLDTLADAASRKAVDFDLFPMSSEVAGFIVGCMTEQLPNPESRVSLSNSLDYFGQRRAQVALRLDDADRIATGRLVKAISQRFGQVGIGRVRINEPDRYAPWPPRQISYGSHNMGTTRMSRDAATGVVDSNLRLHSVGNLYVAGSSVFPTGGHVPPTLTLVALAIRLADFLRSRQQ